MSLIPALTHLFLPRNPNLASRNTRSKRVVGQLRYSWLSVKVSSNELELWDMDDSDQGLLFEDQGTPEWGGSRERGLGAYLEGPLQGGAQETSLALTIKVTNHFGPLW